MFNDAGHGRKPHRSAVHVASTQWIQSTVDASWRAALAIGTGLDPFG
jgi:hypothetical protein